jgi:N-formylglutamate deformylase
MRTRTRASAPDAAAAVLAWWVDPTAAFQVLEPELAPAAPVVVHVPHSGVAIPADVRAGMVLDDAALDAELRAITDHRTDVLAVDAGVSGATRVVNRMSRLVVDPERFLDVAHEEMERVGMGAVYTATSQRGVLRRPTERDRQELLQRFFVPYHAALDEVVASCLRRTGRAVVVDLHSYPRRPLPYELHGDGPRPPLCLGTDPRHTPPWLVALVTEVARRHGIDVAQDTPFRGTFVPSAHVGDPRVASIMLEIRRDTYVDEATLVPHEGERSVRDLVTEVAALAARHVGG